MIPSRDRIELLKRAIESVVGQTYAFWEIVVVDDGSSQAIEPQLEPAAGVRIVRNEAPTGPAKARNQGAAQAKGQLIAFLDDDDMFLPNKIELSVECLSHHPGAIGIHHVVAHTHFKWKGRSGRCEVTSDPLRRMLLQQPPHPSGLVVRSEVHDRIRFDESFTAAADLDYCLRLALDGPLVELDQVLAEHGSEASSPSLISLDRRIAAREQFHKKHASLFRDPEADAYHHIRLAHLYRRSDKRSSALRHAFMALRMTPTSLKAYRALILALLPARIHQFLVELRR